MGSWGGGTGERCLYNSRNLGRVGGLMSRFLYVVYYQEIAVEPRRYGGVSAHIVFKGKIREYF